MPSRAKRVKPRVTHTISIPAAAFGVNDYRIEAGTESQTLYAPVYLPDGANITKIAFIVWHTSITNVSMELRYLDSWKTPNNFVINTIGTVSTANPPTAMQDYYAVVVDHYLVKNGQQTYVLVLNLPGVTAPRKSEFYTASIEYQVA